jgi:4-hydroxythreonine-4-phosphate dehydrogenase
MTRPLIALTVGDPAGVGPEIAAKALADPDTAALQRALVIGDRGVLEQVVAGCRLPLRVRPVAEPEDVKGDPGTVELLDLANVATPVDFGHVDGAYGRAAVDYIEAATKLAREGRVDGIVTGPINKEAIRAAGSRFPGHTEMLADLLGVAERDVITMFVVERLRIFFLTRHHPLRKAIELLDEDLVYRGALRVHALMRDLGYDRPRLALAALNPHAGENRLLGDEEADILIPALERARAEGVEIAGPIPADSVFWQGRQGGHDAVLSLYHDQGHVAAKTVSFFGTVSCTLGLPVIRTAAEHGTAFDIAGRWIADPGGQVACMRVAAELAPRLRAARSTP